MSLHRRVGDPVAACNCVCICLAAALSLAVVATGALLRQNGPASVAHAAAEDAKDAEDHFREALREAQLALHERDARALRSAGAKLAQVGGAKSMQTLLRLLRKVPAGDDGLYWALVSSVSSFRDAAGFAELTEYIRARSHKPVASDLLLGLCRSRSVHVLAVLREFALSGPAPLRTTAVQKLGRLRSARAVTILIHVLQSEEEKEPGEPTRLMWLAAGGLQKLTGKSFGPSAVNWDGWWKKQDRRLPRPDGVGGDLDDLDDLDFDDGDDLDDLDDLDDPDSAGEFGGGADPTGTAVDFIRVDPTRREMFLGIEKAPPQRVVVLTATFTKKVQRDLNNDHMEFVLKAMRIPHTVVSREDFLKFDLSDTGVVVVNCAQYHEFCINPKCVPGERTKNRLRRCSCGMYKPFSAKLSDLAIEKLRRFVLRGGYLFCEDWTLREIVQRAFPKYVAAGHKLLVGDAATARRVSKNLKKASERSVYLGQGGKVDVVPARDAALHPYLRGVFSNAGKPAEDPVDVDVAHEPKGKTRVVNPILEDPVSAGRDVSIAHTWVIDDESYALKITRRRSVVPLLVSQKLQRNVAGQSTVALAFRPGRSRLRPGQPPAGGGKRAAGVVAVVLSHFGKQETDEDEFALQNLLVNFLLDAHVAQNARPARK